MEHKMSRPWSGFRVLCVVLLLSLENGAFGSIDPGNLRKIVKYITDYGLENDQYAVVVRLDGNYCRDPSPANLQRALPQSDMEKMHDAIIIDGGIYTPEQIGNVVAARPNFQDRYTEHAEWRLLVGGLNSPIAKILKNKGPHSCLIFFSKRSPCLSKCLNLENERNVVQLLNHLFEQLNEDSKAFVFETLFWYDSKKEPAVVEDAWRSIKDATLFRCGKNANCVKCFDNNDKVDRRCLPRQQNVAKTSAKGGQSWHILG